MHGDGELPPSPRPREPAPAAGADRNLLFGIIALQVNFITREQLVVAFDAWVQNKSKTLPEILERQGALPTAQREVMEKLVGMFLEKHGGDAENSLAALSSVAQVRPDLERLNDPDLTATLAYIGQGGLPEPRPASTLAQDSGTSLGRFRILRPHAKGGLGQVSVALDQELSREVALKEIQPQHADNQDSRQRFVLEAEITGGLEHPGIVPVYALGQGPDGRPFYAMRFVKGDSLKQAIEVFHKPDNRNRNDPGARQLALRQLLGRFIDVCNAMEYAHSRGVLHRDLKPGNIMVGKYGETLVVDWGLAKSVNRQDIVSDEAALRPSSAVSSSGQTRPGSAIGTPAYMSPEQAAGKLEDLGPASDVYSLGATLYHVLCGRPPFQKETLDEILAKVQRGDFPKPRSVDLEVPVALEAICLKAMALKPADRYQTARSLSDDLEHWLADEPVTAAPDSLVQRVSRVGRRHKGAVRASISAVFVIAVLALTATVLVNNARRAASKLADDNATLAGEKGALADKNAELFEAERDAKTEAEQNQKLADERADKLKRALARNYFDHGVREYAEGRITSGLSDLTRAWAMTPADDPLYRSYSRVLVDRCLRGARQLVPPMVHSHWVNWAAFSPDGKRVVTASYDKTACLWDTESGARLGHPMQHDSGIWMAVFSPDGTRVVTAGHDGTARLWEAPGGTPLGDPLKHKAPVDRVAFSTDGERVMTGCRDGTVRLWNAHTGAPISEPRPHPGGGVVVSICFSGDGTLALTGAKGGSAQLWDGLTGAPIGQPLSHRAAVWSVAFSPDGTRLVTGSFDKTCRLWDARTGSPVGEVMTHEHSVRGVAFNPQGTRVVSASTDHTARIWDAATGAPVGHPMKHDNQVETATFSPDGKRVATGSYDQTARLWDAETGEALGEPMRHEGPVSCVAFSGDGTRLLTASRDRTARVWDGLGSVPAQKVSPGGGSTLIEVVGPNQMHMVTVDGDTAHCWDLFSGAPVGEPMWHPARISNMFHSPDASLLVTVTDYGSRRTSQDVRSFVLFWDARSGVLLGEPIRLGGMGAAGTGQIGLSLDAKKLFTVVRKGAGKDATTVVQLWDVATRTLAGERNTQDLFVNAVFSPDSTRIVTTSQSDAKIPIAQIWDTGRFEPIGEPMIYKAEPLANAIFSRRVSFTPDGTGVLTVSDDTVRRWDGFTGAPRGEPMRHPHFVSSVVFSGDGHRLATGTQGNTAHVWDVATGTAIGEPVSHEGDDNTFGATVALSPDGARLLTTANDWTARLWDVRTGAPLVEPMRYVRGPANILGTLQATFSPEGELVVTSGGFVRLWDATTGASLFEPISGGGAVFAPDRTRLLTTAKDRVCVWDVALPDVESIPWSTLETALSLWSGFRADSDGAVRVVGPGEREAAFREGFVTDPLREFIEARRERHRLLDLEQPIAAAADVAAWTSAALRLRKSLSADPDDTLRHRWLALCRAHLAAAEGRYATALAIFDRLAALDPQDSSPRAHAAVAALALGNREHYTQEWDLLDGLTKSVFAGPSTSQALFAFVAGVPRAESSADVVKRARFNNSWHCLIGATLVRDRQFDQAVGELTAAAERPLCPPWAYLFLAMALENTGSHEAALEAFRKAERRVQKLSGQTAAWARWDERVVTAILQREAAALLKIDIPALPDLPAAVTSTDERHDDIAWGLAEAAEVLRRDPNNVEALNNRAWIWGTSSDPALRDGRRAVESAKKACELSDWKNVEYIDTLAAAYAESGDFENAVHWQTRAFELAPEQAKEGFARRLELFKTGKPYRE